MRAAALLLDCSATGLRLWDGRAHIILPVDEHILSTSVLYFFEVAHIIAEEIGTIILSAPEMSEVGRVESRLDQRVFPDSCFSGRVIVLEQSAVPFELDVYQCVE